jgi:ABC-type phosphate transport system auxiliary subunit
VQNEALAGFSREEWEQLKGYLRRILDNTQALAVRGEKDESAS